jgi:Ca2+-binding RTX toxin-like protein
MAKIKGSGGNDSLSGTNKADHISGRGGNDTIFGLGGNDKLSGDDGDDQIFGDSGNDKISGGKGNDTIYGGDGKDRIDGGKGNDSVYGGDGNDKIDGGKGNDIIVGGAGADKLTGGAGNDLFRYLAASDSATGSWDRITDFTQGQDKIDLSDLLESTDLVWGDQTATANGVWYQNLGSSTFVYADTTGDKVADLKIELKHTAGLKLTVDDFIGVSAPVDNTPPVANGDIVLTNVPQSTGIVIPAFALLANDTDAENDPLSIGTVIDPVSNDADTVALSSGNVTYTDQAPQDGSFQYTAFDGMSQSAAATVTVDTQPGDIVTGTAANEILIASNVITGSTYTLNAGGGNDFLFGGDSPDMLNGEAGNDVLNGGSNFDVLDGGEGNDTLSGGDDIDTDALVGGNGVDLLDFSHEMTGFSFALEEGGSGIAMVDGDDIYVEMEGVIGGSGNDSLTGNAGDNILRGGAGSDTLTGGDGSDIFDYNALSDAGATGDVITDFQEGLDDLDLHDLLATFSGYDGTNAFSGGYLQFDTSSAINTVVRVDSDGLANSDGGVDSPFVTLVALDGVLLNSTDTGDFIL